MMGDISFLDEKIAYARSVEAIAGQQGQPLQQQQQGQDKNFVV
jgi:hypothetical protein